MIPLEIAIAASFLVKVRSSFPLLKWRSSGRAQGTVLTRLRRTTFEVVISSIDLSQFLQYM